MHIIPKMSMAIFSFSKYEILDISKEINYTAHGRDVDLLFTTIQEDLLNGRRKKRISVSEGKRP